MERGRILVARQDRLYVFKLVGEVRKTAEVSYKVSAALNEYVNKLMEARDFDSVVIDLTELTCIDSMNLGLLAQIGAFMREAFNRQPTVISTRQDITALLHTMGLDCLFTVIHEPRDLDANLEELPPMTVSERDTLRMVLEAHKTLAELSDKNRETFKDVIAVLETQMGNNDRATSS
ncbi:MAG TPA: anti-anti-sigma factor [Candidatus Hydrogenedentes bacterium]|nr:anti-anti-sigma factor [Candidatus Hydrogenedentota bacterium]